MTDITTLNPKLFYQEAVDPETADFNRKVEKFLETLPPTHEMTPEKIRNDQDAGKGLTGPVKRLKEAQDRIIRALGRDVPVRVFIPEEVRGVYLHMHGGGFVLGHPYHFDELLAETAKKCRLAVVSVDYRLAPENPYPAAADDCETVAFWLVENVESAFGAGALLIGGESAGANLSVVTLARMRDRHGFTGFKAANLVYGCYDISMTPSQRRWGERNLIISTPTIEYFNNHYVPEIGQRDDPDVSPLYADLSAMPPSLFTVGTLDPLLDDTLFMYTRWLAAGNEAELAVYPGGTHVFNFFPIKMARKANETMWRYMAKRVDSPE
jgi:acetyl esterase/lipase